MRRGGVKSFVDDLVLGRGVVISRAATSLRSVETQPLTRRFVRTRRATSPSMVTGLGPLVGVLLLCCAADRFTGSTPVPGVNIDYVWQSGYVRPVTHTDQTQTQTQREAGRQGRREKGTEVMSVWPMAVLSASS